MDLQQSVLQRAYQDSIRHLHSHMYCSKSWFMVPVRLLQSQSGSNHLPWIMCSTLLWLFNVLRVGLPGRRGHKVQIWVHLPRPQIKGQEVRPGTSNVLLQKSNVRRLLE